MYIYLLLFHREKHFSFETCRSSFLIRFFYYNLTINKQKIIDIHFFFDDGN